MFVMKWECVQYLIEGLPRKMSKRTKKNGIGVRTRFRPACNPNNDELVIFQGCASGCSALPTRQLNFGSRNKPSSDNLL